MRISRDPPLLRSHQRKISTFTRDEFLMSTAFRDGPVIENENLVGIPNRTQPVGDDQTRAAAAAQGLIDEILGHRVERARCFVEHDERRIAHQRARDLQPLSLTAAEVNAALRHCSLVALRPTGDVGVNAGVPGGALDRGIGNGRVPESEIAAYRPRKKRDLLIDECKVGSE